MDNCIILEYDLLINGPECLDWNRIEKHLVRLIVLINEGWPIQCKNETITELEA